MSEQHKSTIVKHILHASPLKDVNPADYFDNDKGIYRPVPVFPFLSDAAIDTAIQEYINTNQLRKEVEHIHQDAINKGATIPETNLIICLTGWHEYPELIKLLTITREWAFRNGGGGVGSIDYDEFDPTPEMQQLIIINPDFEDVKSCIVGGYRFVVHNRATYENGPMGAHYQFSEQFKQQQWIELGRSFLTPYIDKEKNAKRNSINFVLYGLGYIYAQCPTAAGYFGKVTLYNIYEQTGADQFFLGVADQYLRKGNDVMVNPDEQVPAIAPTAEQAALLDKDVFKGLFHILRKDFKVSLVPIMAVYNRMTSLSNVYYYGAFRHAAFGNSTEVGIAITYEDLYESIVERFIDPFRTK